MPSFATGFFIFALLITEMDHCGICGTETKLSGAGTPSVRNGRLRRFGRSLTRILRHDAPHLGLDVGSDGFVLATELLRQRYSGSGHRYTLEDLFYVVSTDDKRRFQVALSEAEVEEASGLLDRNSLQEEAGLHTPQSGDLHTDGLVQPSDPYPCSERCLNIKSRGKKWCVLAAGSIPCSSCLRGEDFVYVRATQGHSLPQIESSQLLTIVNSYEQLCSLVSDMCKLSVLDGGPPCGVLVLHGTYLRNWPQIKEEGLKRMSRRHIHLIAVPTWEQGNLCDCQGAYAPRWECMPAAKPGMCHPTSASQGVPFLCKGAGKAGEDILSCSTLGSCGLLCSCSLRGRPLNVRLKPGFRQTCDLLVVVNFRKAVESGIQFYFAANGVVCTEGNCWGLLPPNCLSFAFERQTGKLLHL